MLKATAQWNTRKLLIGRILAVLLGSSCEISLFSSFFLLPSLPLHTHLKHSSLEKQINYINSNRVVNSRIDQFDKGANWILFECFHLINVHSISFEFGTQSHCALSRFRLKPNENFNKLPTRNLLKWFRDLEIDLADRIYRYNRCFNRCTRLTPNNSMNLNCCFSPKTFIEQSYSVSSSSSSSPETVL